MTTSFTIFVCSTFSDLSQEREGVLDAIRRLKLQHDSMEFGRARAEQPIETCLQEVRASDVLVIIVGHRYGSIVPELGISYSEAEYSESFEPQSPALSMRDENVPILPKPGTGRGKAEAAREMEGDASVEAYGRRVSGRQSVGCAKLPLTSPERFQDLEEVAKARSTARTEGAAALLTEVTTVITDALGQGVPEASFAFGNPQLGVRPAWQDAKARAHGVPQLCVRGRRLGAAGRRPTCSRRDSGVA